MGFLPNQTSKKSTFKILGDQDENGTDQISNESDELIGGGQSGGISRSTVMGEKILIHKKGSKKDANATIRKDEVHISLSSADLVATIRPLSK